MTPKPVVLVRANLGKTKFQSRFHVSDGSPYSESQFKTLKYCSTLSDQYGFAPQARKKWKVIEKMVA